MSPITPIAAALLSLLPMACIASDNLLTLYRDAQVANASYLAVQAGAEADRENKNIVLGQLLPSISASGNYGHSTTDRKVGIAPEERFDYDTHSYSLNFRQPIYRKYNFALYSQAKADGEAADARVGQAGNDLLVRLTTAYMEALFADDQIRLLAAQKSATQAQLIAAKKGMLSGSGTRIDVDEAQARFDMIEANEVELENNRQHSRRTLGALVNRDVALLARLDMNRFKLLTPAPMDVAAWVSMAEAGNGEYQELLAQRRSAEQEVEKATAGHYPTLDLVASVSKSGNDNLSTLNRLGGTESNTTSYGIQLTVPLYAGGQVGATERQASAKLGQAFYQAEDARRNLSVQTRREYDKVVQGIARIRALERAEASGLQVVASAKKGVTAGVRSTLDVLQVEQQYFTTLRDLSQARYAYLIAGVKLKGLAGSLADKDMAAINLQLEAASESK